LLDRGYRASREPTLGHIFIEWNEYTMIKLKNGSEVCLELLRPGSTHADDLVPFAERISEVFGKSFWHTDDPAKRWPVKSVMRRLPRLSLAILAFDTRKREPVGYALFDRISWGDHSILFVDSEAVSGRTPSNPEDWQSSGLGIEMLEEGLRQLPSDYVAARTQNAAIVHMLRKLKPSRILPIDTPYFGEEIELLKAIKQQVIELKDSNLDLSTGICKRVYKEGKLGDYESRVNPEILQSFENAMTTLDGSWDRSLGDAVILTAQSVRVPRKQIEPCS
jgi:hypothetical protein